MNTSYEMIIGLVSPIGVNTDIVIENLKKSFSKFNYIVKVIKVVDLPYLITNENDDELSREAIDNQSTEMPELRRVAHEYLKKKDKKGFEIYAAMITSYIQGLRIQNEKFENVIYILDNLKHPSDIDTLHSIYSKAFYTIGITAPINQRIKFKYLESNNQTNSSKADIQSAINKAARTIYDDFDFLSNIEMRDKWANSTSKAYQLSDFFININEINNSDCNLIQSLERFVDIICGAPTITPTAREHSMFLAYMYSLRSADLSRQVGSAITNSNHDILSLGANEVPKSGGGQYWSNEKYTANIKDRTILFENDNRDYTQGFDANAKAKHGIYSEITNSLIDSGLIESNEINNKEIKNALMKTSLNDITEFGRVVHAEMSSILSAARNGISVKNTIMYCTTYPCHNCAKHIIAVGIDLVEYIEPYPKSKANSLHKDSIFDPDALIEAGELTKEEILKLMVENYGEDKQNKQNKVVFRPYTGIGPKKYLDLFSMKLGDGRKIKRKKGIEAVSLVRDKINIPRVPISLEKIIFNESLYLKTINNNENGNLIISSINKFFDEINLTPNSRVESFIRYWEKDKKEKYGYIFKKKNGKDYLFNIRNLKNRDESDIFIGKLVSFKLKKGRQGIYFADKIEFPKESNEVIVSSIKNWDSEKGVGFIKVDFGNDYVLYENQCNQNDIPNLKIGVQVSFKIKESKKGGYHAINVKITE